VTGAVINRLAPFGLITSSAAELVASIPHINPKEHK
jgi:hypothetical protein